MAKGQRKLIRKSASFSKVGLEGFDDLKALLRDLPRATERNVQKKAVRIAMGPMLEAVRGSVPVLTGKLRDSIRLLVSTDDPGYRARARAAYQAKGSARGVTRTAGGGVIFASIRVGGRGAFHAPLVEFGTVKMAADPFLRSSFDAEAPATVNRLRDALGIEVRKAAARRAKKLAKKGL